MVDINLPARQKSRKIYIDGGGNLIIDFFLQFVKYKSDFVKEGGKMIWDNIRYYADKLGASITEVEAKAGIANGLIGRWKDAKRGPTIEYLTRVAKVLGVTVDQLINGESDERDHSQNGTTS